MTRGSSRTVGVRYSLWEAIPNVYRRRLDIVDALEAERRLATADEVIVLDARLAELDGDPDFVTSIIGGFDDLWSTPHAAAEDLDLYLDPLTCPPDFLPWLSSWLGLTLNERWPLARRREFVHRSVEVFRWRGTLRGLANAIELYTGRRPDIVDSGAVTHGGLPSEPIEGGGRPWLRVTIGPDAGSALDLDLISEIVQMIKPAHVRAEVTMG